MEQVKLILPRNQVFLNDFIEVKFLKGIIINTIDEARTISQILSNKN